MSLDRNGNKDCTTTEVFLYLIAQARLLCYLFVLFVNHSQRMTESLLHLGWFANSQAKSFLPIVTAWVVWVSDVLKLLDFCGLSKLDASYWIP